MNPLLHAYAARPKIISSVDSRKFRGDQGIEFAMQSEVAMPAAVREVRRRRGERIGAGVSAYLCFLAALANAVAAGAFIVLGWRQPDERLTVGGFGLLVSMFGWVWMGSHFLKRDRRSPT